MANRVAVDNVEPDPNVPNSEPPIVTKPEVKTPQVETPSEVASEVSSKVDGAENNLVGKEKIGKALILDKVRAKAGKTPFSAFLVCPPKVSFQNQKDEEQVVLLLRAHVVTNVPWIIISFLLLLVPFIIIPIVVATGLLPVGPGTVLVLTLLWVAGVFSYAFLKFLYWYFNVYIVTTEQVVDIDWYNVVYKAVSATHLNKIQDVTSKQGGVLAGIFDYGDVVIQTAGTEENFEFTNVPHPQEVAEEIQELMEVQGAGKIAVDSVGGGIR